MIKPIRTFAFCPPEPPLDFVVKDPDVAGRGYDIRLVNEGKRPFTWISEKGEMIIAAGKSILYSEC